MNNEDTVVLEYFKNKKNGFYVDVGCYHPFHRNNTYLLYKQNWNGINIDTSQFSIDLFNYMRPKDLNYNCAISNKKEIVKLFYQKELSQLSTIDYDQATKVFQGEIKEREINIKFLSTVSGAAPIEFYPSVQNLLVITDTVSATTYIAENKTNKKITVSIVPSVSPGLAADNVKKIQCFCLDGDIVLEPYEKQEWPLRFFIDSDLRKNVNDVYLSYTLFEKDREEIMVMKHEH